MLFRTLGTNELTMQLCFLLERLYNNWLNPPGRIKMLNVVESAEYKLLINALQLACIYMDLRNVSCLTSTSVHHWQRDRSKQKPEPLDNWIRCLSSANQNAHPKHWIVLSAYTKSVVFCIVHCMMQSAMMCYHRYWGNLNVYVCNVFWTAFLFL